MTFNKADKCICSNEYALTGSIGGLAVWRSIRTLAAPQCAVLILNKSSNFNSMLFFSSDYNELFRILEGCLTMHLPHEINWNASLMQLGIFIDVFLVRHVSGTYAHHQEHYHRKHDLCSGSQDHHPSKKTRCRKPYTATQHLMLLMMGVCTRNMSN